MNKLLVILAVLVAGLGPLAAQERIENLRCEYRANPLGIDTASPRLSWMIAAAAQDPDRRGQAQTAYQILAASDAPLLEKDQGDLWDSGKVMSDQSVLVPYAGKPLASRMRCYWKVRVWDNAGKPSAWSKPAEWAMGILSPADWQAKWVCANTNTEGGLADCSWVWFPEFDARLMAPPGTRYFRKAFTIPDTAKIREAAMLISADNSFRLFINGQQVGSGDTWEAAQKLDVAALLKTGENIIAVVAVNGGTSLNEAGLIGKLIIKLADGRDLVTLVDATWKTSAQAQDGWMNSGFNDSAWVSAKVAGPNGCKPWGKITVSASAMPVFRRGFEIAKPIRKATVFVSGLGFYELSINGRKVGDAVLDPGWTDYRKSCLYSAYDVTAQLAQGRNALGIMLGNGMYNVPGGRYVKFTGSFGPPKFILQLHVDYTDGSSAVIASDASWKWTPGPIVFSCMFGGEDYDARKELPGWDAGNFNDAAWSAVAVAEGLGGALTSQSAPQIKVMEEFKPVKVTQPKPGVAVYDFGQNCASQPRLVVRGPSGASVRLTPGELLDKNGFVSQGSSGGPSYYTYTLKGQGTEQWRPRFFYYGSRYLQVETSGHGATNAPHIVELTSQFVHASAQNVGTFSCGNPLVNRIHGLIVAALRSNFESLLTDCPHREKLGWLECTHLLAGCLMFNYDVPNFYAKITDDMRHAQLANGMVPDIAPEYTVFSGGFRDSPEWGSAYVIAPWLVYQMYGDRSLLTKHYEGMKRYVDYLKGTSKGNIVSHGLGDWYDIGPGGPGESQLTSRGVTGTAVFYQDILILKETALMLGKTDEAKQYEQLAAEVKTAFNAKYFNAEKNQYDRNSQTANAMPLAVGLVPAERRGAVLETLVNQVRAGGNRVTAGDIGFHYLVQALSEGGRGDVLYDMICRADGPGYAYQLQKGATSLTEAWDTNPGSSQNHCMLGHAEEWFYRGLGGISSDPAGPGFKKIIIKPQIVGDLNSANVQYDSLYGRIVSNWKRENGKLTMYVVIPPNTTATIYVPAKDAASIKETVGDPAFDGVKLLRMENGAAVYTVGAGHYGFVTTAPAQAGTAGTPLSLRETVSPSAFHDARSGPVLISGTSSDGAVLVRVTTSQGASWTNRVSSATGKFACSYPNDFPGASPLAPGMLFIDATTNTDFNAQAPAHFQAEVAMIIHRGKEAAPVLPSAFMDDLLDNEGQRDQASAQWPTVRGLVNLYMRSRAARLAHVGRAGFDLAKESDLAWFKNNLALYEFDYRDRDWSKPLGHRVARAFWQSVWNTWFNASNDHPLDGNPANRATTNYLPYAFANDFADVLIMELMRARSQSPIPPHQIAICREAAQNLLAMQHRDATNFALPDASGKRENYTAGAFRYGMFDNGEFMTEGKGWFHNPKFRDYEHGGVLNGRAVWALGEILRNDPRGPLESQTRDALALALKFCLHDGAAGKYVKTTRQGNVYWRDVGEHAYLVLGMLAACEVAPDLKVTLVENAPTTLRKLCVSALNALLDLEQPGHLWSTYPNVDSMAVAALAQGTALLPGEPAAARWRASAQRVANAWLAAPVDPKEYAGSPVHFGLRVPPYRMTYIWPGADHPRYFYYQSGHWIHALADLFALTGESRYRQRAEAMVSDLCGNNPWQARLFNELGGVYNWTDDNDRDGVQDQLKQDMYPESTAFCQIGILRLWKAMAK